MGKGELVPTRRVAELLGAQGGIAPKLLPPPGVRGLTRRGPFPDRRIADLDLTRIVMLPSRRSEGEDWTERFRVEGGTMALRPIQSTALRELAASGGLVGAIPVGQGKTLVGLLSPVVLGATRPLLLVPAQLREQTLLDIERYGRHFRVARPFVRSYEELSTPARTSMLSILVPDLIVADEAHKLRYSTSTRVRRVARYLREHPECRFVALSGTITRGPLTDFAHLLAWALGERSPLPLGEPLLTAWNKAVEEDDRLEPTLAKIRRRAPDGSSPRETLQHHLSSAGGIILSGGEEVACSLVIHERFINAPETVAKLGAKVAASWQSPDGDELESPLARDRVLGELACGFYYYWDWSPSPWNGRPDEPWLETRAAWHKAVRHALESDYAIEGRDSPMLLAQACLRGGPTVPRPLQVAWERWVPHKDKAAPPVLARWVDSFRVEDAIAWAMVQEDAPILWYVHRAVGDELARRSGFEQFGEGAKASAGILSIVKPRPIVASIPAHGHGKNLQVWGNQLFVGPVRSASIVEQALGRLHRYGQARDEVTATFYVDGAMGDAYRAAVVGAVAIHGTTGQPQRLLYATRAR